MKKINYSIVEEEQTVISFPSFPELDLANPEQRSELDEFRQAMDHALLKLYIPSYLAIIQKVLDILPPKASLEYFISWDDYNTNADYEGETVVCFDGNIRRWDEHDITDDNLKLPAYLLHNQENQKAVLNLMRMVLRPKWNEPPYLHTRFIEKLEDWKNHVPFHCDMDLQDLKSFILGDRLMKLQDKQHLDQTTAFHQKNKKSLPRL